MREPAEGTILTVVREMAHRVASELAHMEKQRLSEDATDEEQDELLAQVLEQALEAAEARSCAVRSCSPCCASTESSTRAVTA